MPPRELANGLCRPAPSDTASELRANSLFNPSYGTDPPVALKQQEHILTRC